MSIDISYYLDTDLWKYPQNKIIKELEKRTGFTVDFLNHYDNPAFSINWKNERICFGFYGKVIEIYNWEMDSHKFCFNDSDSWTELYDYLYKKDWAKPYSNNYLNVFERNKESLLKRIEKSVANYKDLSQIFHSTRLVVGGDSSTEELENGISFEEFQNKNRFEIFSPFKKDDPFLESCSIMVFEL